MKGNKDKQGHKNNFHFASRERREKTCIRRTRSGWNLKTKGALKSSKKNVTVKSHYWTGGGTGNVTTCH